MRRSLGLFYGFFKRDVIMMKRYPLNTAGSLAGMYGVFLVMYLGGQSVVEGFDETLGALIVGFFLFIMGNTSYSALSNLFRLEAQWGTLERLYLSPIGFGRISVLMSLNSVIMTFLIGFVMLVLMLVTTGRPVSIDLVSIVPIVVFTIMTTIGLGFTFGGATVRYKRIESIVSLVKFAFVGLIAAGPQAERVAALKLLPLVQGSYLLQRVMNGGEHIWELPASELGILVAVGLFYFLLGYLSLAFFTDRSREQGVMGHY